jgi:glycine oxidase
VSIPEGGSAFNPPADAVIVGGGVIGLAVALRLAQHGRNVVVVDPAPAGAATHAAAGMLAPVSEVTYGEAELLRLGLESLRRYPDFVTDLERSTGHRIGLRREGTMIVATDAGDRARLVDLHAFQTSLGLTATMLSSRECRALEPMLAPEIRCGLLVTSDHSVDNRRLAAALLVALETQGVAVIRQRARSVVVEANRISGVELATGETVPAGVVVLAAGPWSGALAGVPTSSRPAVRPVKGEILRLRTSGAIPLPDHSIRGLVNGHEIYLVPRSDGELVVGATVEDAGFDTTVRAGAVRELLRDARAIMPAVDELELVESIAALRPGSPDNAPMIGSTSVDGLFVASGHHRNGILLAPITADLVTAAVNGTASADELALLDVVSPQRFEPVGSTG